MTTWLTPTEAAKRIGAKNSRRITQAIKDGDLQAVNPFKGNTIQNARIDSDKLDAWMESQPFEPGVSA